MPFTCKVGDSFKRPDSNGGHRWVILTRANQSGCIVIVNFTDARNNTCPYVFTPRDHKVFSLKQTTLCCSKATIVSESKLKLLSPRDYEYFDERLVAKIAKAVIENIYTPLEVVAELKTQYPDY